MRIEEQTAATWGIQHVMMLVMAMVLAGSSVVIGKLLVDVPVFLATFSSLLVALIAMLLLMRNRLGEVRKLTFREWSFLFLQGLCGIVLFRVFTLYGLHSTGAVQAGIVTGTTPAVLAFLSFLLLGENLSRRSLVGIGFAVIGCISINIVSFEEGGDGSLMGCLLVLLAVVCEALFTIFRKRIAASVTAMTNTAVLILCSLAMLAVPAGYELMGMQGTVSQMAWLAIIYYGLVATVCAYLLWTSAVGRVPGAVAGVSTAAMPASSIILAAAVLGEQLLWQHILGAMFIIGGILITARR